MYFMLDNAIVPRGDTDLVLLLLFVFIQYFTFSSSRIRSLTSIVVVCPATIICLRTNMYLVENVREINDLENGKK